MTILDVSYPAWMDDALCSGSEVNFFPEVGQTAAAARAVCQECPVRAACLQWAVDEKFEHGVFGGVPANDRRWLQPESATWKCPECPRAFKTRSGLILHRGRYCGVPRGHGTNGCYATGCRCASCKSAHATYARGLRSSRSAA